MNPEHPPNEILKSLVEHYGHRVVPDCRIYCRGLAPGVPKTADDGSLQAHLSESDWVFYFDFPNSPSKNGIAKISVSGKRWGLDWQDTATTSPQGPDLHPALQNLLAEYDEKERIANWLPWYKGDDGTRNLFDDYQTYLLTEDFDDASFFPLRYADIGEKATHPRKRWVTKLKQARPPRYFWPTNRQAALAGSRLSKSEDFRKIRDEVATTPAERDALERLANGGEDPEDLMVALAFYGGASDERTAALLLLLFEKLIRK